MSSCDKHSDKFSSSEGIIIDGPEIIFEPEIFDEPDIILESERDNDVTMGIIDDTNFPEIDFGVEYPNDDTISTGDFASNFEYDYPVVSIDEIIDVDEVGKSEGDLNRYNLSKAIDAERWDTLSDEVKKSLEAQGFYRSSTDN